MRRLALLGLLLALGGCSSLRLAETDPRPDAASLDDDIDDDIDDSSPDDTRSDASVTVRDAGADAGDAADAGGSGADTGKIASITIGENVACVVFEDGAMRCWGSYLLAGGGSTSTPKPSPIPIRASDGGGFLTGVAEVAASYRHACARLLSGKFACWGFNNEYQLGDFTRDSSQSTSYTPFARLVKDASAAGPLLEGAKNLAGIGLVSAGTASSAAIVDGAVLTWGYISGTTNTVLGRGQPTRDDAIVPKPVLAIAPAGSDDRLLGAKHVSMARAHACAALAGNTVACWGDNASGKLGIGSGVSVTDGRPRRVSVPDGAGLVKVAVGVTSACAVTAMDRVRCWGQNNLGQAGISPVGSFQPSAAADVKTTENKPLDRVIDVGVGDGFACALGDPKAGGKVHCWGKGAESVLGDGTTEDRAVAGPVAGALAPVKADLTGARLLAVGRSSACVVLGDADVRCWGRGPIGERGSSSSTSTIPRPVDDL